MSKELKAQDLKLGNYLMFKDKLFNVAGISSPQQIRLYDGLGADQWEFIDTLQPIPLTEDWLAKLPEDLVSEDIPSWIVFLHQLQNWYWIEKKCTKELQFK